MNAPAMQFKSCHYTKALHLAKCECGWYACGNSLAHVQLKASCHQLDDHPECHAAAAHTLRDTMGVVYLCDGPHDEVAIAPVDPYDGVGEGRLHATSRHDANEMLRALAEAGYVSLSEYLEAVS